MVITVESNLDFTASAVESFLNLAVISVESKRDFAVKIVESFLNLVVITVESNLDFTASDVESFLNLVVILVESKTILLMNVTESAFCFPDWLLIAFLKAVAVSARFFVLA